MKKHSFLSGFRRFVGISLCLALCICLAAAVLPSPTEAAAYEPDFISVGLYFVKNALPAANLQNVYGYGSGYELGMYVEDRNGDDKQFVPLAETDEEEISMLIDQTMYLRGNEFRLKPAGSDDVTVGAFHLELAYSYDSYDAAKQAAENYADGFVAYSYDSYFVRFGSFETFQDASAEASQYADCVVTGNSEYGITVVGTKTGRILFELEGPEGIQLGVVPRGTGETRTWFRGNQYNGAFRYTRPQGGYLHVVSIVPLEQYVAAVLSREFVPSWPDETLKAAACCIRTICTTAN